MKLPFMCWCTVKKLHIVSLVQVWTVAWRSEYESCRWFIYWKSTEGWRFDAGVFNEGSGWRSSCCPALL